MRSLSFFPDDDSAIWLSRRDAMLSLAVLDVLDRDTVEVLEIGVFRGAWALTVAMNVPGATVSGIDPYPGGDVVQQARVQALRGFADRGLSHRFRLFPTWDELLAVTERPAAVHLVHVDGHHDEVHATIDLERADRLLAPDGVIIVDDYRHSGFPGVASAMYRFLERCDYRMFLATENKAFLCRTAAHSDWYGRMRLHLVSRDGVPGFEYVFSAGGALNPDPARPDVLGCPVLLGINPVTATPQAMGAPKRVLRIARLWLPPVVVGVLWRARERWRARRRVP
jgi:hypothetical protein